MREGGGRRRRGIRKGVMTLGSNATRRGNTEVILIGKPHECVPCMTATINTCRAAYQLKCRGVSLYTVLLHVSLQTATGITGRDWEHHGEVQYHYSHYHQLPLSNCQHMCVCSW